MLIAYCSLGIITPYCRAPLLSFIKEMLQSELDLPITKKLNKNEPVFNAKFY